MVHNYGLNVCQEFAVFIFDGSIFKTILCTLVFYTRGLVEVTEIFTKTAEV